MYCSYSDQGPILVPLSVGTQVDFESRFQPECELWSEEEPSQDEVEEKKKILSLMKSGTLMVSNVIEMLLTPDLEVSGWSHSLNDRINEFDPVFEKIYETYFKNLKNYEIPAPVRWTFMLVASLISYHFSQKLIKSIYPMIEINCNRQVG